MAISTQSSSYHTTCRMFHVVYGIVFTFSSNLLIDLDDRNSPKGTGRTSLQAEDAGDKRENINNTYMLMYLVIFI